MNKEQIEQAAKHYAEVQWGDPAKVNNVENVYSVEDFTAGALFMQAENERLKGLIEEMYKSAIKTNYADIDMELPDTALQQHWLQFAKENNII